MFGLPRTFVVPALISLTSCALADADFRTLIRSGDDLRQQMELDTALQKFRSATGQARNATERGIAIGKQAEVHS